MMRTRCSRHGVLFPFLPILPILLLSLASTVCADELDLSPMAFPVFESTVFLTRSIGPSSILDDAVASSSSDLLLVPSDADACAGLTPEATIVLSHPASVHRRDRFYGIGGLSYQAIAMTVDFLNTRRCGVVVNQTRYAVDLQTLGDNSNAEKHRAIGEFLVNNTDFFLAGYSSSLTQHLVPLAQEARKVIVTGGSSRTNIYEDREYAFGILPRASQFYASAVAGVARKGARTILTVMEEGTTSCEGVSDLAPTYGMTSLGSIRVPEDPDLPFLIQLARNVSQTDPDVVVTCMYVQCPFWIRAMRTVGWTPRAQIFGVCGEAELEGGAAAANISLSDLAYMMGAASWNRALRSTPDALTGWDPEAFAQAFEAWSLQPPAYQQVAAATSLSVLLQAIEEADSLDSDDVREVLAQRTFNTMYGRVSFDDNGQNQAVPLLLQYNEQVEYRVVFPPVARRPGADILYPLPTWGNRDCVGVAPCGTPTEDTAVGFCTGLGYCNCTSTLINVVPHVSLGFGPTARCRPRPDEDLSYISDSLLVFGLSLVIFQALLSTACIVWTIVYRKLTIVRASQPFFLIFIAVGCFILVLAILPTSVQGGYRFQRNLENWEFTSTPASDIRFLDASCMAFPWLTGLGFAMVFSSLFAKIWRVKKMIRNVQNFRRGTVEIKDVMSIVVCMIFLESIVLLTWNLVAPLRWERDVLLVDSDGLAVQSVGKCRSDDSLGFYVAWCLVNGACLIYALWLCYITRSVSDDYAESKWITISIAFITQILLLAVPVLIIAEDDRAASYILQAMVVFSVSSSVTLFIFGPKVWRLLAKGSDVLPRTSNNSPSLYTNNNTARDPNNDDKEVSSVSSAPKPPIPTGGVVGGGGRGMAVVSGLSGFSEDDYSTGGQRQEQEQSPRSSRVGVPAHLPDMTPVQKNVSRLSWGGIDLSAAEATASVAIVTARKSMVAQEQAIIVEDENGEQKKDSTCKEYDDNKKTNEASVETEEDRATVPTFASDAMRSSSDSKSLTSPKQLAHEQT